MFSVSHKQSSNLKEQNKNNVVLQPARVCSTWKFPRRHAGINQGVLIEPWNAELKLLLSVVKLELGKSRRHGSVFAVVVHDLEMKRISKDKENFSLINRHYHYWKVKRFFFAIK